MSVDKTLPKPRKAVRSLDKNAVRKELVAAIKGKYAWIPYSSEEFNHDKRGTADARNQEKVKTGN